MKNVNILIIDSDEIFPKQLCIELKNINYNTINILSDFNDAYNNINDINPDLVFINYDGQDELSILKFVYYFTKNFGKPIVLIISKINDTSIDELKKLHMCHALFRPFNKSALKLIISKALYEYQQETKKQSYKEKKLNDQLMNVLKLQKSILPKKREKLDNINVDWIFFPSYHGSGDIFNCFKLGGYHVGFYLLDVMGHGFQSALMSTIIHRYLYPDSKIGGIVRREKKNSENNRRRRKEDFQTSVVSPKEVLLELNKKFSDSYNDSFFTIIYGIINTVTYEAKIARAGHHYPVYISPRGNLNTLKSDGQAIGFTNQIEVEEYNFVFEKGARLYLYSDGLIEIKNKKNKEFSKDLLFNFLKKNTQTPLNSTIKNLEHQILHWAEYEKFEDDIALLALERSE